MQLAIEKTAKATLVLQRNLFLCLSVCLFLVSIALSVVATRTEAITLFKSPEAKLESSSVERQAQYLAHLILNRSAATWETQNSSLAEWVAPCFRIPLARFLRQAKSQMLSDSKNFEWELKDSAIQLTSDNQAKVFLSGALKVYISSHGGGKQLVEQKEKSYFLEFVLLDGKPLLESFQEAGGGHDV